MEDSLYFSGTFHIFLWLIKEKGLGLSVSWILSCWDSGRKLLFYQILCSAPLPSVGLREWRMEGSLSFLFTEAWGHSERCQLSNKSQAVYPCIYFNTRTWKELNSRKHLPSYRACFPSSLTKIPWDKKVIQWLSPFSRLGNVIFIYELLECLMGGFFMTLVAPSPVTSKWWWVSDMFLEAFLFHHFFLYLLLVHFLMRFSSSKAWCHFSSSILSIYSTFLFLNSWFIMEK